MFKRQKPPLLKTIRDYKKFNTSKWQKFRDIIIYCLFIIILAIGVYQALITPKKQRRIINNIDLFIENTAKNVEVFTKSITKKVSNFFQTSSNSSQASLLTFKPMGIGTEVANNTKLDDNIIMIIKIKINEKYYQNNDVALDSLLTILNPNDVSLDGFLTTLKSNKVKEIIKQPIQENRITKNSSYEKFKPGRKTNRPTRRSVVIIGHKNKPGRK